jgi:hypothetical protein
MLLDPASAEYCATYRIEDQKTVVVIAIAHVQILGQTRNLCISDGISVEDIQPEPSQPSLSIKSPDAVVGAHT